MNALLEAEITNLSYHGLTSRLSKPYLARLSSLESFNEASDKRLTELAKNNHTEDHAI